MFIFALCSVTNLDNVTLTIKFKVHITLFYIFVQECSPDIDYVHTYTETLTNSFLLYLESALLSSCVSTIDNDFLTQSLTPATCVDLISLLFKCLYCILDLLVFLKSKPLLYVKDTDCGYPFTNEGV